MVLECVICYNLFQIIVHMQLVYVLGYKFCMLFYVGWLLIYIDLDIFGLILWMVYGSFLIILFVMSFNWVEGTRYVFFAYAKKFWLYCPFYFGIAVITYVYLGLENELHLTTVMWFNWTSYYEVLIDDLEEELEMLGWSLGFDNFVGVILISLMLTVICVCVVCIVQFARKSKLSKYFIYFYEFFRKIGTKIITYLRTQCLYMQCFRVGGSLNGYGYIGHNCKL